MKYQYHVLYLRAFDGSEIASLLESEQEKGWEFVSACEGYYIFRKPKEPRNG